ncbi:MAG: Rrf2 family transcriptional regulator [Acidimicrobiia bacterium]
MRLVIGRKVDLAIRALHALANDGERETASRIAESIDTSEAFLPQVMSGLVATGIVSSERGPGGGYRLEVPLGEISVLDVVTAVEGPVPEDTCVLRGGPCGGADTCSLHEAWTAARAALVAELDATPLDAAWPG